MKKFNMRRRQEIVSATILYIFTSTMKKIIIIFFKYQNMSSKYLSRDICSFGLGHKNTCFPIVKKSIWNKQTMLINARKETLVFDVILPSPSSGKTVDRNECGQILIWALKRERKINTTVAMFQRKARQNNRY